MLRCKGGAGNNHQCSIVNLHLLAFFPAYTILYFCVLHDVGFCGLGTLGDALLCLPWERL